MAAAIPRHDFPGFLPVGTHEVHGVRDTCNIGHGSYRQDRESGTRCVRDTPGQFERVRETCIVANGKNFEHLL